MKTINLISIFLLLAACAQNNRQWSNPNPKADMGQDYATCQYQARMATASNPSWMAGAEWPRLEEMCMRSKGYSR